MAAALGERTSRHDLFALDDEGRAHAGDGFRTGRREDRRAVRRAGRSPGRVGDARRRRRRRARAVRRRCEDWTASPATTCARSTASASPRIVFDDVIGRPRCAAGRRCRGARAARRGRRLRHRAALRRGGRRDGGAQRRDARLREDPQAVRPADRALPGPAAPDGRHVHPPRAGALDGLPRRGQARRRAMRPSVAARRRPRRSASARLPATSASRRCRSTAAWASRTNCRPPICSSG